MSEQNQQFHALLSGIGPDLQDSAPLKALLTALKTRYGDSLVGVLLYGSCLRSGELLEGLVDLYAVVDDYRQAYRNAHGNAYHKTWLAVANRILPPNVFYLEVPIDKATVRSKYAVVSLRDLQRGTSVARFESYFWGRFAQPTRIVYSRDPASLDALQDSLLQAAATFITRALPLVAKEASVLQLWTESLALSYGTELRTERSGRAQELSDHGAQFFEQLTRLIAPRLPAMLQLIETPDGLHYRASVAIWRQRLAGPAWRLRKILGKLLSVTRLVKAFFTFDGGLDYIAWKLARHSGQSIEVPDSVRRWPLILMWPFFWRLYRRGIFK